jgi:hypothetical protein
MSLGIQKSEQLYGTDRILGLGSPCYLRYRRMRELGGAQIDGRRRGGNDGQGPEGTLSNTEYYSLRYSQDGTDEIVNVWGVASEETNFALIVQITEKWEEK